MTYSFFSLKLPPPACPALLVFLQVCTSLSIRSVCLGMVVILQTSITFYFIVCNVKYRVPTGAQQSFAAEPARRLHSALAATQWSWAFRHCPAHITAASSHRSAEQSKGAEQWRGWQLKSGSSEQGKRKWNEKGPTKMHMKRNLQDTSNTFTQGSCFQGLFVKSKLRSGMLRPSVNQEASQNFEVHVPRCFPSWQASWICRKI